MQFEGEVLTVGGRQYIGSVFIETDVSDASFSHEHGTEHVIDIDHNAECFVADGVSRCAAQSIGDEAIRSGALDAWLAANLDRVEKRFDIETKR